MPTINDNGESLVDLRKYCPGVLLDLDLDRKKIEKSAFARLGVAKKLNIAIRLLPPELTFKIADAWRPQYIQDKYFNWYTNFFARENPSWSKTKIIAKVKKFVHPSKGKYASGHLTGGALDLVLAYRKSGKRLPLKMTSLTFQENSLSKQTKLSKSIIRNRNIMFKVLEEAGFVNYSKEYWHWSYGDIYWAEKTNNRRAIYDIKKSFKK